MLTIKDAIEPTTLAELRWFASTIKSTAILQDVGSKARHFLIWIAIAQGFVLLKPISSGFFFQNPLGNISYADKGKPVKYECDSKDQTEIISW